MATESEERKLSCACSKQLAKFTKEGLELYCRYSKEVTTVPYGIGSFGAAPEVRVSDRKRLKHWT